MKKVLFLTVLSCLIGSRALGEQLQVSNPASLKVKVYKVAFSASQLCTDPVTVYSKSESEATYIDFLGNPTLADGASLDDGTYPCVIIEFSDLIKYTTTATDGSCAANTEYTGDVCRDQGGSSGSYQLIDGTTGTCSATTGVDNHIAMYLSTGSTSSNGGEGTTAFLPPLTTSDSSRGFNLASAFIKSGAKTGTFVVDGTGKITGAGAQCEMQPPTFSFE